MNEPSTNEGKDHVTTINTIQGLCRQLESGNVPSLGDGMTPSTAATILTAEPLKRLANLDADIQAIDDTMEQLQARRDAIQAERSKLKGERFADQLQGAIRGVVEGPSPAPLGRSGEEAEEDPERWDGLS